MSQDRTAAVHRPGSLREGSRRVARLELPHSGSTGSSSTTSMGTRLTRPSLAGRERSRSLQPPCVVAVHRERARGACGRATDPRYRQTCRRMDRGSCNRCRRRRGSGSNSGGCGARSCAGLRLGFTTTTVSLLCWTTAAPWSAAARSRARHRLSGARSGLGVVCRSRPVGAPRASGRPGAPRPRQGYEERR